MNTDLWKRDFTLVVLGQIISLFGNATLRFALPLYLLNQTGSASLFGAVTALSFLPAILLSPVGGILADRVNKRNVMVALDFFTGALVLAVLFLLGRVNLAALLCVAMMLLYGIAGAYQPSVQASMPALVSEEGLMAANSVINTVSSFSALTGPVLGGILYSAYGILPVLKLCAACFFLSAVMELFIRIPFQPRKEEGGLWQLARRDLAESFSFIFRERPEVFQGILVTCAINLFLSAAIIVGLPYLVTEVLPFSRETANRLYGYAQGAMAAGSLAGGIGAGIFAGKLRIQRAGNLLIFCACSLLPMAVSLGVGAPPAVSYLILTGGCFVVMVISALFTIQVMAFVQRATPRELIGKVIALLLTLSMCAQPLGNALYGLLFSVSEGREYLVLFFSGAASLIIALGSRRVFGRFAAEDGENKGEMPNGN